MPLPFTRPPRALWSLVGVTVTTAALALTAALPTPALAATPPVYQKNSKVVTADALPTVQIEGIVWKQVIAGNTVFAGGRFSEARPAGAARGQQTTARWNLLSYDIRTGELTSFAPQLDGQVRALALSPDKKTLYVGGSFTKVGDVDRPRFAAFDVATGKLRGTKAALNGRVSAITTLGSTVYLGGTFTKVGTTTRQRAAAVSASSGKLTAWNPTADGPVEALVVTPNKGRVVMGGSFGTLRGTKARGMGAVTTGVGAVRTWKINAKIQDYGAKAAILSLAVDKDTVYGTGYGFEAGNFEGVFAAKPTDGAVKWLQDCHGDTYDVAPVGDFVYSVGHAHYCKNIGGFEEIAPQRALAVTRTARGTVAKNGQSGPHYKSWAGNPAPALINWFPQLDRGTASGTGQGPWSVAGNAKYVVLGGEFTTVNGQRQEGLVRFTTPGNGAPTAMGPQRSGRVTAPAVTVPTTGRGLRLAWEANHDLDDQTLYYDVLRDGEVVHSLIQRSTFWRHPVISWVDTGAVRGERYAYAIRVTDHDGNSVISPTVTATA